MLGSAVMVIAIGIQTLFTGIAIAAKPHLVRRIGRQTFLPFTILTTGFALWVLFSQTLGVWIWAVTLWLLGAFETFEPALYYALASFTTVGFGDVVATKEWRLFGTMAAANGMLSFGLAAASLVNLVGGIRRALGEDH